MKTKEKQINFKGVIKKVLSSELPARYRLYSAVADVDKVVEAYKMQFGIEPEVIYEFSTGDINYYAIEIKQQ